jgi:hypothetical protein
VSALADFTKKWCFAEDVPKAVSPGQLNAAERELGVRFSRDNKKQILESGLPFPSLALLGAITDRDQDIRDLSQLSSPEEICAMTKGWRKAGMPGYLVVIANDCGGNSFCFDERLIKGSRQDSSPVFFRDHETGDIEKMGDSFSDWISIYLGEWCDGLTATVSQSRG